MRIDKRKFFGSIIGVTMFVVMLLAFTYAYYTWRSNENPMLSFNINDSYFYCESGIESNITGLTPVSDYREAGYQTFTVNNVGREDTTFSLTMNITSIDEALLDESFKYKLVVDETGGSNDCTDINDTSCVEVGSGSFANAIVGMNTLVETIQIPNNAKYQYYLFMYIDGEMENDTAMQNASMTSILEVCEIVVFLDYDGGNADKEFLKVNGTYEGLPTTTTRNDTVITYNTNGGNTITPNTITYTFNGWYTEQDGAGTNVTNEMEVLYPTNHTLYANWNDSGAITLPEPIRSGYTFDGWYSDEALTQKVGDSGDSYQPESSITLYAKWLTNAYLVTFNANGGTLVGDTEKHVEYGSTYGTLPTATKLGYTFNGWYTAASGGTQITSDTVATITGPQTLYAQWTPNTYNISYAYKDGQHAEGANAPTTATYDTNVIIDTPTKTVTLTLDANNTGVIVTSPTITKEQKFAGWSSNSIDTTTAQYGSAEPYTAWDSTGTIVNDTSFRNLTPTAGARVYLDANWEALEFSLPTATAKGYTCSWNTAKDGKGTSYASEGSYIAESSASSVIALYAICEPNVYNISYTLNGGKSGAKAPGAATYDTPVEISNPTKTITINVDENGTGATISNVVIKQTQTFSGWSSTTIDTSTAYFGSTAWTSTSTLVKATSFKNLTPINGGTVTLVANWAAPSVMPLPTITKEGHTCTMNTVVDGSGTSYDSGANYTPSTNGEADITLYAQCTPNTYTVTLDNQSADYAGTNEIYLYSGALYMEKEDYGVNPNSLMTTTGNSISIPSKAYHTFKGYYTEPDGDGLQILSANGYVTSNVGDFADTITADTILYADWDVNVYTINLIPGESLEEDSEYTQYICEKYGEGIYLSCNIDEAYLMTTTTNPIVIPTRSEYTFGGYYTEEEGQGEQLINSEGYINSNFTSTKFTSGVNLYAAWEEAPRITYYNGSKELGTSTCKIGESLTLKTWESLGGTVTNSSYGWGFAYWTDVNNSYELKNTNSQTISCPSSDISLYAVYSRTITFKSGATASTTSIAMQYWNPYGTTSGTHLSYVTPPTPISIANWTAFGYVGHTETSGAGATLGEFTPTATASSVWFCLYSRTLTFYSGINKSTNDGTQTQFLNSSGAISNVKSPTPASVTNWTTLGYRSDTSPEAQTYNYNSTISPAYTTGNDFYAVYSRELIISYDGNGNTGGTAPANTTKTIYLNTNSTTTSNQTVTLWANDFTKTGYTFSKWAAGSTDGTQYEASTSYTPNLAYNAESFSVTMYAIWRINKVIINYNANGGYLENTSSVLPNGTTREWMLDDDGTVMAGAPEYEEAFGSYWGKNFSYLDYGDSSDLANYNATDYFALANYGLGVQTGAEWICLSGCTVENATFSQSQTYSHSDFCDASAGDCTVVLGVNWNKLVTATTSSKISFMWNEPGYVWYDDVTATIVYYPETGDSITYEYGSTEFTTIYNDKYISGSIASGTTVYVEKTNDNELVPPRTSANYSTVKWQKIWVRDDDHSASLSTKNLVSRTINDETYYAIYYNYTGTANKLTNIGDVE